MEGLLKKKEVRPASCVLNTLVDVGRICIQMFIYWSILLQALGTYLARAPRDGGPARLLTSVEQSVYSFQVFILNLCLLVLYLRWKVSSQWLTGSPFSIEGWGIFIYFCWLGAVLLYGSGLECGCVMLMPAFLAAVFYFIANFYPLHILFALYMFGFCVHWL